MQHLDEKVTPFLKSMIAGDSTPLSPARQTLLARWAATTAAVMERACDSTIRTPRFACEHLRRTGVHPGTQVLVGRYHGDLQVFTHERDLFSRTINGARHYLSQSTFVMGNVLIQVFADPWRSSAPELADDAPHQLVALLPGRDQTVNWPPEFSIDDADYDLVRHGPPLTPRDLDPGTPDDAHDDFDHRDFGVASVDLLAADALRLRSPSEPPRPATDGPIVGFLIERCTEIATGDGLDAAAKWLAANAWIEGAIAERARIERLISEG
jgi:hypothetical protein